MKNEKELTMVRYATDSFLMRAANALFQLPVAHAFQQQD